MCEDDGFAPVGGEFVEEVVGVDNFGPQVRVVGAGLLVGDVVVVTVGGARAAAVVAHGVDPGAARDGEEPRAGGGAAGEAWEGAEGAQVGLLGEVVGGVVSCEVGEEAPDVVLGGGDEVGEGSFVAPTCPEGEVGDVLAIAAVHE